MNRYMKRNFTATVVAFFQVGSLMAAEIGPADDLEVAAASLRPGDELVLRGGTYFFDENVTIRANGTAALPITIRAKDGERPVIEQATANNNVVEINGSSYLTVRGIEFTGGSHGIRLIDSDFITIEECEIHETGDVALSANSGGTYEGLKILRNHRHHTNGTGEGMYLGCNNDGCRVVNSLIEGNYVHHTNRSSVEQGDGIEIKEGSYGNIVRDNVIHDTNYPGLLLYSTVGNGPPNIVEGNVVWNVADNAIQVAADAIIRNNIILGNVALQRHQAGSPSNLEFVHNTVISNGNAVEIRDVSGSVLVANNAIYAQGLAINVISGNTNLVQLAGNVGEGGLSGAGSGYVDGGGIDSDMINGHFRGLPPIDPFPTIGSALVDSGAGRYVTPIDFNGNSRDGIADVGAYSFDTAGNPGWAITTGFKTDYEKKRPMPVTDLKAE